MCALSSKFCGLPFSDTLLSGRSNYLLAFVFLSYSLPPFLSIWQGRSPLGKLNSGTVLCLYMMNHTEDGIHKFSLMKAEDFWQLGIHSRDYYSGRRFLSTIGLVSGFLSRNYERERKCG